MICLLAMVNLQALEKLLYKDSVQSVRVQGVPEDSTGRRKQHDQGYTVFQPGFTTGLHSHGLLYQKL